MNIRPATPQDVPQILTFIRELAVYEREPDAVLATEADLLRDGFGLDQDGITPLLPQQPPRFQCIIAEVTDPTNNEQPTTINRIQAGFALYFTSYSTWRGHHGIRLEDLYVTPSLRGQGIGKALLAHLARIAVEQGCPRLEWDVLAWNAPAIAVYESIRAQILTEWRIMRLTGEPLTTLARLAQANAMQE
jgi:ribosomal protein S18 acetylase RimI-like enzyme